MYVVFLNSVLNENAFLTEQMAVQSIEETFPFEHKTSSRREENGDLTVSVKYEDEDSFYTDIFIVRKINLLSKVKAFL